MKIHEFIEKLQNMSTLKKHIVLWTIVAIFALVLGYFWVRETAANFEKINKSLSQISIPQVQIPATDASQTTTPTNK